MSFFGRSSRDNNINQKPIYEAIDQVVKSDDINEISQMPRTTQHS
jgi:hypothetical protein